ncbi:DUF1176 domain-containing protein [Acidovorax sp. Root267]|uniref:DUF1176 domain-containing protein n=1 Tax=Acidovorax sp. Root267 TaxID=1736505 RepID=UPI001F5C012D|nr:DUF1176 domain-containing protein [Acidovorax sp. Root267]
MRIRSDVHRAWRFMACALAFAAPLVPVQAADNKGAVSFQHKDWALQCDNTRTCRAVGYQPESGDSEPVSILLTRDAGPDTPVLVGFQVSTEKTTPASLHLKVGKLSLPGLKGDAPQVAAGDVPRLLQELLKNEEATLAAGKDRWVLSLAGASAVLLKMDEAQGRVGTPGALVRRGTRPEASVLPPLPAPVVKAVSPLPTRKGDATLAKPLIAALDRASAEGQCNGDDPFNLANVQVYRLTERKLLLSVPCGMGAYNFTSLLWMANDRPPYKPEPVQDVDGEFDPATGSVHSAMKGRGIGDCWWVRQWQFDGQGFVLTSESGDSMCRGFAGGAWQLPSYVTR